MSNEIPRRSRIDLFTPAEKAIFDASAAVESAGADIRLTAAQNKLHEARALVADFVDGVPFGQGYPRVGGVANGVGPTLEHLATMTAEERSRMTACAPSLPLGTAGVTTTVAMPLPGESQVKP